MEFHGTFIENENAKVNKFEGLAWILLKNLSSTSCGNVLNSE